MLLIDISLLIVAYVVQVSVYSRAAPPIDKTNSSGEQNKGGNVVA